MARMNQFAGFSETCHQTRPIGSFIGEGSAFGVEIGPIGLAFGLDAARQPDPRLVRLAGRERDPRHQPGDPGGDGFRLQRPGRGLRSRRIASDQGLLDQQDAALTSPGVQFGQLAQAIGSLAGVSLVRRSR